MYDIQAASRAQREYCDTHKMPLFAPAMGVCWRCGKNIYRQEGNREGISVEVAGTKLITHCPHCNKSFVD